MPLLRRACAGDRPVAAGLHVLLHARRQAREHRRLRRRASTRLMTELGHERYLVAGGDWGASIAVRLAHAYPDAVRGAAPVHDAAAACRDVAGVRGRLARGARALDVTRRAATSRSRARGRRRWPTGSSDSPVGLMSWIGEKFERWTDSRGVPDDDLLTTVMIYWVDGLHRLLVLALLGAQARRLGARRGGRGGRPDRRAADLPRLPEGARARAARGRRSSRSTSSAGRRRATAGTSRRWRRPTCSPTACGASSPRP